MRRLFFLATILIAQYTFGQNTNVQEKNTYNTNTVPATNSGSTTISADSVFLYEKDEKNLEIISTKKAKASTKSSSYELKDAEQSSSKASTQSAVQSFSVSKSVSSQNRSQRTPTPAYQQQMDAAVDALETSAPESFEYHFFSYQAGNYNVDLVDHLNKAEELRPNNSDVQIQKAAYHVIMKEDKEALNYLAKLKSSKRLSDEVTNYAKDLLLSVPKNGVLITHGCDDTYGSIYEQLKNGERKDVQVISLDLLQSKKYRENISAAGFKLPTRTIIDVTFLSQFCSLNKSKGLTISLTVPKEYLVGLSDKLYVTGLVFQYEEDPNFNNFSRNDELWNGVLKKTAANKAQSEKAKQLSSNYLPMLLVLSQVYGELNEPGKKQEVDAEIDRIAVQCNKYEQVKQIKSSY